MVKHLKLQHPKQHLELIKKKDDKDRVVAEKRKASEADEEMENGTALLWNLRTSGKRKEFLVQSKVSNWCANTQVWRF